MRSSAAKSKDLVTSGDVKTPFSLSDAATERYQTIMILTIEKRKEKENFVVGKRKRN